MSDTYKRAVFVGEKEIRIDEVPIPEPGPHQALVKVKACALCTWEQRMYFGHEKIYPLSGGHEVAGELVSVGPYVHLDAKPGDRVMCSPLNRCGYCDACRNGLDNICENANKPVNDSDVPGPAGLAEYMLLEDYQVFKSKNDIPFEELALSEPLACVTRSIRKSNLKASENAVIIGAGIMGLLHLRLAKNMGARVIVSEVNQERAQMAKKMGADEVIDPTQGGYTDQIKALTDGRGADVVYCAVSIASALEQSFDAIARGGRVMVYASIYPKGSKISIDPNPFHSREITLTGTVSQGREDVHTAVKMISNRLFDMRPFISKTYPFSSIHEAFEAAIKPDTYRVVLTMD
ncbi:MAG: zinc-binding dehydrogenase [Anaerolineae bacterium]|jgi:L-iditol 2-dehydrogenase|nr:zinc-binding dehydrogenase [Anaerolineae bacterium]